MKEPFPPEEYKLQGWRVVKRLVTRIGVRRLWFNDDGRWAVTLNNRTYSNWFDIPPHKVGDWMKHFDF
jgi:hypothetical protein